MKFPFFKVLQKLKKYQNYITVQCQCGQTINICCHLTEIYLLLHLQETKELQIVIEPLNCSDSVAYVSTLRRQTKSCDSICLVLVAKEIHCTYCRILNICQCDGSILIDFGISFQQQICQWDVLIFDLHSLVYGWNNFL